MHSYRMLLGCLASMLLIRCGGSESRPGQEDAPPSSTGSSTGGTGGESIELEPASGSGASNGGSEGSCSSDAECDDGDACTTDACAESSDGEFSAGQCTHELVQGSDCDELPPAVESCQAGCADAASAVFPAATPIEASKLPAACANGFEMNRPPQQVFTIEAPGGSADRTLEIDIATYTAPDHIRISGVDQNGVEYTLLENCSMRTATYADPTGDGCSRPPDETIRQYTVQLKAGTKSLSFDMGGACTPTYMRVMGLCDFDITPFFSGCRFRVLP
jgi:hypothetical protein